MDNVKKLERFKAAVLEDGREKADEILSQARQQAQLEEQKIKDSEDILFEKSALALENELELVASRESARLELNAKKNILSHRKKLVESLFDDVRTELEKFVNSDKYKDYLFARLEKVKAAHPQGGECIIREADAAFAEEIKKRFGFEVEVSGKIKIGGAYVRPQGMGVMIDETLDSAFEEQCEAFSSDHSELELLND